MVWITPQSRAYYGSHSKVTGCPLGTSWNDGLSSALTGVFSLGTNAFLVPISFKILKVHWFLLSFHGNFHLFSFPYSITPRDLKTILISQLRHNSYLLFLCLLALFNFRMVIGKFRLKLKTVGKNHWVIQVWPKSNPLWLYSGSNK